MQCVYLNLIQLKGDQRWEEIAVMRQFLFSVLVRELAVVVGTVLETDNKNLSGTII